MSDIQHHLDLAAAHSSLGVPVPQNVRLRLVKRLLQRLIRSSTTEQTIFNRSVLAVLQSEFDARRPGTAATLATLEAMVTDANDRMRRVERTLEEVQLVIQDAARKRSVDLTDLSILGSQVEMLLSETRAWRPDKPDENQMQTLSQVLAAREDDFYRDFEAAFRGSREGVKERQKAYLNDVLPLKGHVHPLVDIGSGRGEWLELLKEHDIPSYGIDVNDTFVDECMARGLDVREGDGIEMLGLLPESSVSGVTAFQVVEHLPLPVLLNLVGSALRALVPGGLVIFETPNPRNLSVASSDFYLDPSHQRPVHPHFLAWVLKSRGFVDVELRFLNPSDERLPLPDEATDSPLLASLVRQLDELLHGDRDYAVIARKASST